MGYLDPLLKHAKPLGWLQTYPPVKDSACAATTAAGGTCAATTGAGGAQPEVDGAASGCAAVSSAFRCQISTELLEIQLSEFN